MENEEKTEGVIIKKNLINQNQIAGAIIIAGLLIAGAILLKGNSTSSGGTANLANIKIKQISPDEHILGNPNAKVMIVEYSDTECPFSKRFHGTMQEIIKEKGGEIAWVYRHFPIAQLHPGAPFEATATECALEQSNNETFWKYLDEVYFRTKSNNGLEKTELPKIASDLGLDLEVFNNCLASEKYKAEVENSVEEISALGTQLLAGNFIQGGLGTPASIIVKKGKIVDIIHGAEPIETVRQKIEKALQ